MIHNDTSILLWLAMIYYITTCFFRYLYDCTIISLLLDTGIGWWGKWDCRLQMQLSSLCQGGNASVYYDMKNLHAQWRNGNNMELNKQRNTSNVKASCSKQHMARLFDTASESHPQSQTVDTVNSRQFNKQTFCIFLSRKQSTDSKSRHCSINSDSPILCLCKFFSVTLATSVTGAKVSPVNMAISDRSASARSAVLSLRWINSWALMGSNEWAVQNDAKSIQKVHSRSAGKGIKQPARSKKVVSLPWFMMLSHCVCSEQKDWYTFSIAWCGSLLYIASSTAYSRPHQSLCYF